MNGIHQVEFSESAGGKPVPHWSIRHWLGLVAVLFLLQVAIIWLFRDRREPLVRAVPPAFQVLQLTPNLPEETEQLLAGLDPTLAVLPSRHGFSGDAWLKTGQMEYRPHAWTEPPEWLDFQTNRLLSELNTVLATNRTTPQSSQLARLLPIPLPTMAPSTTAANPPVSRLQFVSGLSHDDLLEPVNPPVIEYGDVLLPTRLSLLVDRKGWVFSASLVQSSGLARADEMALELVRSLRFRPIPPANEQQAGNDVEGLRRGRLRIVWGIRAPQPQETNMPVVEAPKS